jgi:GNAT superfamily N-acetyltransferase
MSWLDLTSDRLVVSQGVAESTRFGISILNIRCGSELHNTDQLLHELEDSPYDIAVVRYSSINSEVATRLNLEKYRFLVTDPTVYWTSPKVADDNLILTDPALQVVEISASELGSVLKVIKSSFHDYKSHWHFNPKTKHIQMSEAYSEWVETTIGTASNHVFLMFNNESKDPIGMAMIKVFGDTLEILLAGISANHQGKGLYGGLLQHLEKFALRHNVNQVVISTQAGNINVQKAWTQQGWFPAMTVQTLHVEKK